MPEPRDQENYDPGAEALARDWYAQGRHDAQRAYGATGNETDPERG